MPASATGPDCYLGLDLGTSGCRAVAIDATGAVLGMARTGLPPSRQPFTGASEQDPEAWWLAATQVLDDLNAPALGRVRALAVDGTSSTLLLCDDRGIPCSPGLMYDDRRAWRQAECIDRVAAADSPARGAHSALAKLLWLLEHDAEGAAHAAHQADWVNGRLSGVFGVADENNALKLGYDPVTGGWPNWIDALSLPQRLLPEVLSVGSDLATVTPEVAERLGWPDDVRLVAGTTDGNAAALATGIRQPGDAVTALGSTLVIKVLGRRPVYSARHGVYSHRIGDRWLVGGASNTGGRVLRQFFSDAEIAVLSERIDPRRPLDLHYYPLPGTGERFPDHDPVRQPRLDPRPPQPHRFLQAILEGIAEIEAAGYARLAELGAPFPRQVFTTGGGAANRAWQAIRARCLGVVVRPAAQTEAAYGTALIARDGAGPGSTRQ